jgi:hypothetical protein
MLIFNDLRRLCGRRLSFRGTAGQASEAFPDMEGGATEHNYPADRLLRLWSSFRPLPAAEPRITFQHVWIRVLQLPPETSRIGLFPWLIDIHALVDEAKARCQSSRFVRRSSWATMATSKV